MKLVTEAELDLYDVWESPNGNVFIKISDEYSIAIGHLNNHNPFDFDLKQTQYVKANHLPYCKKIGKLNINE